MKVTVLLFARPCEVAGSDVVEVELQAAATYADLKAELANLLNELAPLIAVSRLAAAGQFVDEGDLIGHGVEIALIPPVSGG